MAILLVKSNTQKLYKSGIYNNYVIMSLPAVRYGNGCVRVICLNNKRREPPHLHLSMEAPPAYRQAGSLKKRRGILYRTFDLNTAQKFLPFFKGRWIRQ